MNETAFYGSGPTTQLLSGTKPIKPWFLTTKPNKGWSSKLGVFVFHWCYMWPHLALKFWHFGYSQDAIPFHHRKVGRVSIQFFLFLFHLLFFFEENNGFETTPTFRKRDPLHPTRKLTKGSPEKGPFTLKEKGHRLYIQTINCWIQDVTIFKLLVI